jgi:hypothetical protein
MNCRLLVAKIKTNGFKNNILKKNINYIFATTTYALLTLLNLSIYDFAK